MPTFAIKPSNKKCAAARVARHRTLNGYLVLALELLVLDLQQSVETQPIL
jgi:hypothetical protein